MSQKSSLDFDLVVANEIDKVQSDHLGQDHMTRSSSQTPAITKYSIKYLFETTDKRNDLKGKRQARRISRMTRNKLRRTSNSSSLIHILDDESKTEVKTSPSKDFKQSPSLKLNQEDGSSPGY
jgi:hypothetical protein